MGRKAGTGGVNFSLVGQTWQALQNSGRYRSTSQVRHQSKVANQGTIRVNAILMFSLEEQLI